MDCAAAVAIVKPSTALVLKYTGEKSPEGQEMFLPASGFVFGKPGHMVTCNHVVEGAAKIKVKFPDSATLIDASVLAQDQTHDLAVLTFEDPTRVPLQASTQNIQEGSPVFFCGYPINLFVFTAHQGIISAIALDPQGNKRYLIDGSNNSGNSGGPLLDAEGKVIGVMQSKHLDDNAHLLTKIRELPEGAMSFYGHDVASIYKQLINNVQLGIGQATPVEYVTI